MVNFHFTSSVVFDLLSLFFIYCYIVLIRAFMSYIYLVIDWYYWDHMLMYVYIYN